MNRRKALHEGKAKIIYEGLEPGTLIQYFKDDATALSSETDSMMAGKGILNNRISAHIMTKLESIGVPTHFIRSLNMREQLVRQVEIIPLEIVVRNAASGTMCQRFDIEEGKIFPQPLIEFHYKKEGADENPVVTEQHIFSFDWADPYEIEEMVLQALRINDFLTGLFSAIGLRLIDFKVEFGRLYGEHGDLYLMLADEISPDNCNLWDVKTGEKIDKKNPPKNLGDLVEGYQEIAKRLGLIPQAGIIQKGNLNEAAAEGLEEIENELSKRRKLRAVKKSKIRPV